jgi:UDP-glucose 4-epimerase
LNFDEFLAFAERKSSREQCDREDCKVTDALCLVTGGAGFIGSHVATSLLRKGRRVVIADDLSGGSEKNLPHGSVFRRGDVSNENFTAELFREFPFTHVYHLAAYAAEGLSHFIRRFNYRNNLIGSVNLINESVIAKVKCFVFTSSLAVYGRGQSPFHEEMVPAPEDPYGIAKYAVELDLHAAHRLFGLNFVIHRPHNVFGERQNIGDKYRNVIGIFMNNAMQNKPLPIFGDGSQTRAFSYVDDVANVIAESGFRESAWNQVFNVGADQHYTILELAEAVSKAMNVEANIRFLKPRDEVPHAWSSHERCREMFADCLTNVGLDEGLRRMAAWARGCGPMAPQEFSAIEIRRNLPEGW